ncbi:MAG: PfkB family carbohydrate kinase [Hyphomicrobiales bacterium]
MSILVVGAIHHDVIVDAPSIPRLDETLPGSAVRYAFGGKGGNQAVMAGRLGEELGVSVAMAACLGNDAPGDDALKVLDSAGVPTKQVQRVDGPSGMSVAISLPDGGYGAVIVSASNAKFDPENLEIDDQTQWVLLQNELPQAINEAVARRAKMVGAKVLLNAAPARSLTDTLTGSLDLVVVNRVEAADLLGIAGAALDPESAVAELHEKLSCPIILTLSGDGLWLADGEAAQHVPANHVPVVSTHGAGDAFVGALAVCLCGGDDLAKAARFAAAAAALHVSMPVDQRDQITHQAVQALVQTSSR